MGRSAGQSLHPQPPPHRRRSLGVVRRSFSLPAVRLHTEVHCQLAEPGRDLLLQPRLRRRTSTAAPSQASTTFRGQQMLAFVETRYNQNRCAPLLNDIQRAKYSSPYSEYANLSGALPLVRRRTHFVGRPPPLTSSSRSGSQRHSILVSTSTLLTGGIGGARPDVKLSHGNIGPSNGCNAGEDGIQLTAQAAWGQYPVNGLHIDDVTIHDLSGWAQCGVHEDGIQGAGGINWTIENSHIYNTDTSLILIKDGGEPRNITIRNNAFGGVQNIGNSLAIMNVNGSYVCDNILVQNNTFYKAESNFMIRLVRMAPAQTMLLGTITLLLEPGRVPPE